jgi:hypothetical protein
MKNQELILLSIGVIVILYVIYNDNIEKFNPSNNQFSIDNSIKTKVQCLSADQSCIPYSMDNTQKVCCGEGYRLPENIQKYNLRTQTCGLTCPEEPSPLVDSSGKSYKIEKMNIRKNCECVCVPVGDCIVEPTTTMPPTTTMASGTATTQAPSTTMAPSTTTFPLTTMPPTQRSGNNNNSTDPMANESKFTQSGAVNDIVLPNELSNLDRGSIIVSQHDYTGVGNIYIPMVYM